MNTLIDPETQQACGAASLSVPPYDQLDELIIPVAPYAKGGHHLTNGATWVEYLARSLKMPGDTRPALKPGQNTASNYAVGGARTYEFTCRFNLSDQLAAFIEDDWQTSHDTLFVMEIGGNDVRDALTEQNPGLIANAFDNIANAITYLYTSHNARNFLLVNVPDIGKMPAIKALDAIFPGTAAAATNASILFNGGLETLRDNLQIALPAIDIRILDLFVLLDAIVADPQSFGIVDTEHACVTPNVAPYKCNKPDTYVFWDGIHPTKTVHKLMAKRAISILKAMP